MSPLISFYPFNFHYYKNQAHKREKEECAHCGSAGIHKHRKDLLYWLLPPATSEIGLPFCTRYKNRNAPESMWLPELPVAFLALNWEIFLHCMLHNHPWRIVCSSSLLFSSDRNQKANGMWRVSPWLLSCKFHNYQSYLKTCAGRSTFWNRTSC